MQQGCVCFFSQDQLSVQTPLLCLYSLHVLLYALTRYVCTLKIPNAGNYTIAGMHKNTAHAGRNR